MVVEETIIKTGKSELTDLGAMKSYKYIAELQGLVFSLRAEFHPNEVKWFYFQLF